ncbi:MAG: excisionase family DNA-binding protein [Pyrinomonadaceae bacterium MAG19_C2-C3]|nr:excisionase family DNA-binding protein [Pyrinomonadaceae bacterium MAG19_C2-C3]
MSATLITTTQAADRLGLTVRAVQKMIEAGRLTAQKMGRDYFIEPDALDNIPRQIQGRPPKQQIQAAAKRTTKKAAAR